MASWHTVKGNLVTGGRFNGNLSRMGFQIHIYVVKKTRITLNPRCPKGGGLSALNRVKDLYSNMSFWLFLKSKMSLPSYGVQFFFFDFYGYMSFLYRVNLNLKPHPRQISIEPALSHQITLYSMP